VRDHFIRESVMPAMYLHQWFLTLFINCFPLSMVLIMWDAIICEGVPVILRIAVSILQVLKESLLNMHFEDIIVFFKKMRNYDDEEGTGIDATTIGRLLMKHTEHVVIPEHTLKFLSSTEEACDLWEASDFQTLSLELQNIGSAYSSGWLHAGSWVHMLRSWLGFGFLRRRPLPAGGSRRGSDTSSPRCSSPSAGTDGADCGTTAAEAGDAATRAPSPEGSTAADGVPPAEIAGALPDATESAPAPGRDAHAAHMADSRLPPPSGGRAADSSGAAAPPPFCAPVAAQGGEGAGCGDVSVIGWELL